MSPDSLQKLQIRTMDGIHPARRAGNTAFKKIAVVGVGRVGLPLAVFLASKKIAVVGFDIDDIKIAQLEGREAHFLDADTAHAFKRAQTLTLTADETELAECDVFIVCVSLPENSESGQGTRALETAAHIVGRHLTQGALVVVETRVNPGVCEHVLIPILEKESGVLRHEFFFAHVPERTLHEKHDLPLTRMPRVAGATGAESLARTRALYETTLGMQLFTLHSIKETEAVHVVEEAFRIVNSALSNELAMGFDRSGIDITHVIAGAATKPGVLPFYPSLSAGTKRLENLYYLQRRGHENTVEQQLVGLSHRINDGVVQYVVKLLSDALREKRRKIKGSTIALLHHSPQRILDEKNIGGDVHAALTKKGAHVQTFDPYSAGARELSGALRGAEAIVLTNNLPVFANLTPRQLEEFGIGIVIDACNCMNPALFENSSILYRGLGR